MTQPGLYADAPVYDILHAQGTAAEVAGLERMAARAPRSSEPWLEPACGTARYLRLAARRGHRAIGFDRDPGMIAYAEERVRAAPPDARRRVRLFVGDMTDFARQIGPGRVGFAFNLINTIRHLETDAQMLAHFGQMAEVLRPGGLYAVGLSLTSYGMEFPSEDVWRGARGRCRITQIAQYIPPLDESDRAEQVHSHLVIERPGGAEHRDSSYTLRCYGLGQWRRLIDRSALELAGVVDPDGDDASPEPCGYAIYLLRPR